MSLEGGTPAEGIPRYGTLAPVSSTEPDTLREPTRLVSPKALRLWRTSALVIAIPLWLLGVVALVLAAVGVVDRWGWLLGVAGVLLLLGPLPWITVIPRVRFAVHRWEITDLALYVRHGWLVRTDEIVPLSRIQTVDSAQGPLMRLYGLRTVTVKTASAAGTVQVAFLDAETAHATVATLVAVSAATAEDAT